MKRKSKKEKQNEEGASKYKRAHDATMTTQNYANADEIQNSSKRVLARAPILLPLCLHAKP